MSNFRTVRPVAGQSLDVEAAQQQQQLAQALYARSLQGHPVPTGGPVQAKYGVGNALVDLAGTLAGSYGLKQANDRVAGAKSAESEALSQAIQQYRSSTPDAQVGAASRMAMDGPMQSDGLPASVTPRSDATMGLAKAMGPDTQRALASALMSQGMAPPESYTLKEGETRFTGGRPVASLAPAEKSTDDIREYERALKGGFKGSLFDYQTQLKKAGAPQTSVAVNTDKNLYGTLAESQAKLYSDMYGQAQKAPDLIQRARRVQEALGPESQAITGAGADWMLQGAKVAAQMGFNTGNAASDTEMLSRELASSTLDAIKASGLGSGSGFSNADRDFLEKAVGGKITMEAGTIRRLAALNEQVGIKTMEKWNAQAGRLKPEMLQQLGMSTIGMPEGTPAPAAKPGLTRRADGSYDYKP